MDVEHLVVPQQGCHKNRLNSSMEAMLSDPMEETKQMLRMIPILICTFIPSTMLAQPQTLFIKQGRTLNRSVGSHFQIPPASLTALVTISMLVNVIIYDRLFVNQEESHC
ncbi:unnamed protein product [Citrullus colocynthis]|uniref:Uncharacterized protein n=1 Tax=Citrullus colocynthis TaxID=252529 RepID=A0ABP0YGT2_9ROSI